MRYTPPMQQQEEYFDFEKHFQDLKDRFARNQWLLGQKNTKGTIRYDYEVDFTYLVDEMERGPVYARIKRYEQANNLLASMISLGKRLAARPNNNNQAVPAAS